MPRFLTPWPFPQGTWFSEHTPPCELRISDRPQTGNVLILLTDAVSCAGIICLNNWTETLSCFQCTLYLKGWLLPRSSFTAARVWWTHHRKTLELNSNTKNRWISYSRMCQTNCLLKMSSSDWSSNYGWCSIYYWLLWFWFRIACSWWDNPR